MRILVWIALAVGVVFAVLILTGHGFAQQTGETAVAANSWLHDFWLVIQPIVTTLAVTLGPVIATVISAQIIRLLNIQNEEKRKQVEEQIRNALHQAAANGLKFALARSGIILRPGDIVSPDIMDMAIDYVKTKNPDTAKQAGVDRDALTEIILSKVPDLAASISQASMEPTGRLIGKSARS